MATFSAPFSTPGTSAAINLVLVVNVASQNQSANTSLVSWNFYMQEVTNANPYRLTANSQAYATVYVPVFAASNLTYDFRAVNAVVGIGSGNVTVPHASNGTATISVSGSYIDGGAIIGNASFSTTMALPTIDRGGADHYSGSAWVMQMVEHYNGSSWVLQAVEHFNGTSWVRQI